VPAIKAPLGHVSSVAVDATGNIYAADGDKGIIVEISPISGILTVVAGNGSTGWYGRRDFRHQRVTGPAWARRSRFGGQFYFFEYGRVREVSHGIITTIAARWQTRGRNYSPVQWYGRLRRRDVRHYRAYRNVSRLCDGGGEGGRYGGTFRRRLRAHHTTSSGGADFLRLGRDYESGAAYDRR
jgi:hypothetical protein